MKNSLLILATFFISQYVFASTKTWIGSTSTNWSTASNWSPAAKPNNTDTVYINSASNNPILSQNSDCLILIMSSDAVLDLGGYQLSSSGGLTMTNASITNGSLYVIGYQPFTLTNSLIGVTILNTIGNLIATNNVFTQPNTIKIRSFDPSYSGGNTFEKTTYISNYGEGELFFGYDLPDMFEDSVFISTMDLTTSSTGDIHMAYNSDSNTFNGICQLDIYSASSIYFCDGSDSASVSFYSPVKIGGVLITNAIEFSRNAHFHTGAPLGLSDLGWIAGELRLMGITMDDSLSIVMDNDENENSILIDKGSIFSSKVNCTAQSIYLGEVTFNDSTTFVKTGEGTDQLKSGHIKANAPFTFSNLGYGSFLSSYTDSCSFNSDITLINANEGTIQLASFGLLNIGGNLNISTSAGLISFGEFSTDTNIVQGNIDLNCSGGLVVLGMIKQGNAGTINTISFENSELDLLGYRSTNTDSLIITGTDNSRLVLNQCQIEGPFQVELPSIVINEGIYNGNTLFHKTGNDYDQGGGSMVFHGKAHFKTSSDGDLLLNYDESNNQFWDDLIIECNGEGRVLTSIEGSSALYKNLEFKGSEAPYLVQGSSINFVGNENQHITKTGTFNNLAMSTLLIDKPDGQLIIEVSLGIKSELILSKGIIQLTDTNMLRLGTTSAIVTGGSDSSYVEGAISRIGTSEFTFPTGGDGQYAPISIDSVSSSTTFKASYIGTDPDSLYSRSSKDSTLGFVNRCGYWKLDRTAGTGNTKVKLGWSNNPCYNSNPVDAKVALWDGSQWKDKGNGAYSGNSTNGIVHSSTSLTSFPAIMDLTGICPSNVSIYRDTFDVNLFGSIRFKAMPDSAGIYSFYINNSLQQNSRNNLFLTHNLFSGDTVKVIVDEANMCLTSDKVIIDQLIPSTCSIESSQNNVINTTGEYSSSQFTCECNSSIYNEIDITSKYQRLTSFIPNNESIPIKTINFNIIIPQDPNQPHGGNFNIYFDKFLRKAFEGASKHYEQVIYSSDILSNDAPFIEDAKIRFKLNNIYYFESASMYIADRSSVVQYVENNIDCNVKNSINLILSEKIRPVDEEDVWGSSFSPICSENMDLNVFSIRTILNNFGDVNGYLDYLLSNYPEEMVPDLLCQNMQPYGDGAWWISQLSTHWAHEIGHSLDLFHTYDGNNNGIWNSGDTRYPETNIISNFDFLSDVFSLSDPFFNSTWCNPATGLVCYHQNFNACVGVPTAYINDENDPCNVYGTNNLMGNLTVGSAYISPMQMGKIHRALSLKTPRKYVDKCPYSEVPIEIKNDEEGLPINEVWNMDFRVYNDVIVRSGNTLTITCKVSFPEQAQLLIEPGATLILNGGTLTGSCNMWKGIKLMGLSNKLQGTVNVNMDEDGITINSINTLQGLLLMSNATIENAEEGVFMSDADGNMYNGHTGGIIKAYNSTFRNNFRSVAFNPYKFSSISKFTECTFICNDHLKNPDYYNATSDTWAGSQGFVSLWEIMDVEFIDNKFINDLDYVIKGECPTDNVTKSFTRLNRGDGIGAFDSRFIVRSTDPDNTTNPKRNEFIGLTAGIKFRHTQPSFAKWIHCQDAYFYNVQHSILIENSYNNDLQENSFYLPDGTGQTTGSGLNTEPYGIFVHKYKGTRIIDNKFSTISSTGYSNWGTILRGDNAMLNSSATLTGNEFTGMPTAFQTEITTPSIVTNCNSFTSNLKEWNLFPENEPLDLKTFQDQGAGCDLTQTRVGNKFYDTGEHIWSRADNTWRYYFRQTISIENPVFHYDFNEGYGVINGAGVPCINPADPCETSSGGGTNIHVIHSQRKILRNELNAVGTSIETWTVDAGSTASLLTEIYDTTLVCDSLTAHLKSHSPLSDTVLISAYQSDRSFSNSQLFGIAERNLPASYPVYIALHNRLASNRIYDAIADTLNILQCYNNSFITKEALIRESEGLKSAWLAEINKAIYYYTEKDSLQALIPLFKDTLAETGFEKEMIEAALSLDSLSLARTALDSLNLLTIDDSLFANYAYLNIHMMEDSLNWLQIDSVQKQQLEFLSRVPSSIQSYAMAARQLRGDTIYHRHPYIDEPSGARLAGKQVESQQKKQTKSELGIYPNPNNGTFNLNVSCASTGGLKYEVIDITGRKLYIGSFVKSENKHIENIQLDQLSAGIYFCRVYTANKEILGVQRFIISKR